MPEKQVNDNKSADWPSRGNYALIAVIRGHVALAEAGIRQFLEPAARSGRRPGTRGPMSFGGAARHHEQNPSREEGGIP